MIDLKNISVTFNHGTSTEVNALKEVSFSVKKGDFVVVIGANGSGKSTLLNVISGNIAPDHGEVSIDGIDVTKVIAHKRAQWVSRIFQDPMAGTAGELSVKDNLRLASLRSSSKGLKIGSDPDFQRSIQQELSELSLGLEDRLDTPVENLSGGQRQALTLLMAVSDASKLLLMDEPTAALDPKTSVRIMDLANSLSRKADLTTLLVTHNLRDAIEFGNIIILMEDGKLTRVHDKGKDGTPELSELLSWYSGIKISGT